MGCYVMRLKTHQSDGNLCPPCVVKLRTCVGLNFVQLVEKISQSPVTLVGSGIREAGVEISPLHLDSRTTMYSVTNYLSTVFKWVF